MFLLDDDFHFAAGFELVAGIKTVERAETVKRAGRHRHCAGELLHGIAGCNGDNAKPQRLGLLGLGDAHAAETADRFTKGAIGLRRATLRCEYETVYVAAEPDRVQ